MKYAFFGDIHANIDALVAVFEAASNLGAETYISTGDIVGYGASPKECIELVSEYDIFAVRGNHDEYVTQDSESLKIRAEAKEVIQWTQSVLPSEYIDWLAELPLFLEFDGFEVIHASYIPQPAWEYIVDEVSAVQNFLFQPVEISFNGHTHIPVSAYHHPWQRPVVDFLKDMVIPHNQKCLIGCGSVGQPRDDDPRACFVMYDSESRAVTIHRVDYDISAAQKRLAHAGLSPVLGERLAKGC